jgi:hypothetical protein
LINPLGNTQQSLSTYIQTHYALAKPSSSDALKSFLKTGHISMHLTVSFVDKDGKSHGIDSKFLHFDGTKTWWVGGWLSGCWPHARTQTA